MMGRWSASLLILMLVVPASLSQQQFVTVPTEYGDVRGEVITLVDRWHNGTKIDTFLGIPYATPPVDELRFALPEKADPWAPTVFNATTLETACMQAQGGTWWMLGNDWEDIGEDCLHVNIFAPSDRSRGPYPVLVHFHGGANYYGANVIYGGHFLAAQDVVIVVPNYRLGIFGFAYSGDEYIPGNMGLWDMKLSLEFIRDNIANFGGDPNKVTIFGQSSGATAVGDLILSPHVDGLFHQAGQMSGSELALWSYFGEVYESENYIKQVAERLDCPYNDTEAMTECLQDVPADVLLNTGWLFNCTLVEQPCGGFRVVVDGEGHFLPETPWVMRENGDFKKIPIMLGLAQNDGFSSISGMPPMSRDLFESRLENVAGIYTDIYPEQSIEEDMFEAMNFYYSPWPNIEDGVENRNAYGRLLTDGWYGAFGDQEAKYHKLHTSDTPVYFYVWDYNSDEHFMVDEWQGTVHSSDLLYVFGDPFRQYNPDVMRIMQHTDGFAYNEYDEDYAVFMMDIWANFAKFGNPTEGGVMVPEFMGSQDVNWVEFNSEDLSYFYIGQELIENRQSYYQHEYAFWTQYINYVAYREYGRPEDF